MHSGARRLGDFVAGHVADHAGGRCRRPTRATGWAVARAGQRRHGAHPLRRPRRRVAGLAIWQDGHPSTPRYSPAMDRWTVTIPAHCPARSSGGGHTVRRRLCRDCAPSSNLAPDARAQRCARCRKLQSTGIVDSEDEYVELTIPAPTDSGWQLLDGDDPATARRMTLAQGASSAGERLLLRQGQPPEPAQRRRRGAPARPDGVERTALPGMPISPAGAAYRGCPTAAHGCGTPTPRRAGPMPTPA